MCVCVCVVSDSQGQCGLEADRECTGLQAIISTMITLVIIFITRRVSPMRWASCQLLCPDPSIESFQQFHFTEEDCRVRGIKIPWPEVRTWVGPGIMTLISCVTLARALNLSELHFLQQKERICYGEEVPHHFESLSGILMSDSLRISSHAGAFIFRIHWLRKLTMTKSYFEFGRGLK